MSDYEVPRASTTEEFGDGMSRAGESPVRVYPKRVHSKGGRDASASHSIIRLVVLRFMVGKLSHQALKTENRHKPGSF